MADYAYIAAPRQQDSFSTIGNLVNTLRGATALQRERQTLQADVAQRQAESQRSQTEANVSAQTAQPRIAQAQTESKAAQFKLEGDQSARAMQIAGGLIQDPRVANSDPDGIIDAANEAYSQMVASGIPKNKADFWASQLKAKSHQPGAALQFLQNVTRSNAGSGTQAGVINAPVTPLQLPSGGIAPVQLQPGASGAVTPVPISSLQGQAPGVIPPGIPPAQRQSATTDALGRPVIAEKDQNGNISYKATPGSDYKPLMTLPVGETPETAKPLLALRDQAQQVAAQAPAQHFNNRQILELSDSAFTGTGSPQLAKVLNSVGLQQTNDAGADTAKLQHFIALQIEQNAQAQGANTDAARQLAASAVLPNSSPAQAIKAITKVNDAYATGAELFNRGIQATLSDPGNTKDVFAIRDFQNAWTRNMDPRIFQLENAVKAGDKAEVARIKNSLGPEGISDLRRKAMNLQKLIHGGAGGT